MGRSDKGNNFLGPSPGTGSRNRPNIASRTIRVTRQDPLLSLTRPDVRSPSLEQGLNAHTERINSKQLFLGTAVCAISLIVGILALKASPDSSIGPYGLIQALSPWYYLAIGMLIISFAWSLRIERYRSPVLCVHLAVLVLLIHGAPTIIEGAARFPTAWLHTGFTDYIAATGKTLPALDARFSWPSFFAASAMLDKVAGLSTADWFLPWWPVALNLLYLPLIFRVADQFLHSSTKAWVATGIFPLANWVGQDYYSPQSIAFLLYLAFLYILIGPLGANDGPSWNLFRRQPNHNAISPPELPDEHRDFPPKAANHQTPRSLGFYLGILTLLMAAMATGHQLTPIIATATALVLALAGRTQIRGMIIVFVLMTIGWICYGAETFWSGHLNMLIGGLGSVQSNVSGSVVARVHGSPAHEFVVDVRLLTAAVVWLLAITGAVFWGRQRKVDRAALALCFLASFGMLVGGDYGGEGMLRIYLFSLPPSVCLIAALIFRFRSTYRQMAVAAILFLLTPFFLISRWGNEIFEQVQPNELTAVQVLYRIANPGSTLATVDPELAYGFIDINEFNLATANLTALGPEDMPEILQAVSGSSKGGYVIISTSQIAYGWQDYGMPRTWGTTVEKMLSHSPDFTLRYSNPNAEIFQYTPHQTSIHSQKSTRRSNE